MIGSLRLRVLLATAVTVALTAGTAAQRLSTEEEQEAVRELQVRIDRYLALHHDLDPVAPPLHADIPAAQIAAHRQALATLVVSARRNARRGNVFTERVEKYLRHIVATEYQGAAVTQLRGMLMDDEGTLPTARLAVNAPVSSEIPVPMTPPRMLARLPKLPEELEFRFVGRHFILRDTETELVVDFVRNLVP